MRPLLLLDVDGVLNPDFSVKQMNKRQRTEPWKRQQVWVEKDRKTYTLFLNENHGPKLLTVAYGTGAELAWATTWNEDANKYVGPVLGLPELPVYHAELFNKPATVLPALEGRPFVWLDDQLSVVNAANTWGGCGVKVNPKLGLTDENLEEATIWLNSLKL